MCLTVLAESDTAFFIYFYFFVVLPALSYVDRRRDKRVNRTTVKAKRHLNERTRHICFIKPDVRRVVFMFS